MIAGDADDDGIGSFKVEELAANGRGQNMVVMTLGGTMVRWQQ